MTKKTIIIFCLMLHTFVLCAAKPVDKKIAEKAALMFYYERALPYQKSAYEDLKVTSHTTVYRDNIFMYHVFDMNKGGFVIVSGSYKVKPVLSYSFEGVYKKNLIAPNFKAWMQHYEEQILYAEKQAYSPDYSVAQEWQRLTSDDISLAACFAKQKSVLPLISSRWNQGKFYNGLCPEDPAGPEGRAVVGCVATAMGQLMYYHRWPLSGTGSYSYHHDVYGLISADFGSTDYDWDAMPNKVEQPNYAVAKLLHHLGVAVDMNYGPQGSGMWNHSAARSMRDYFKYGDETAYIFRDSTTLAWDSIIIANLDNKKPLYYAGWTQNPTDSSGHAFICDGYQGTDYFHFDWGWGGAFNGYFYLNDLTPGGAVFNFRQEVIADIYPDTINYTYPVYCSGHKTLTEIVGSLEDGSGINNYAPGADCSWLIAPVLHVNNITLSFDNFETAYQVDFVRVYDGDTTTAPLLGEFSGSDLPPDVTSTGNTMLVTFSASDSTSAKGFKATYTSSLTNFCSPLASLNQPQDTISDGSGPYPYNNYTKCMWRIQPPHAEYITINFLSFDTSPHTDYLEIYDLGTSPMTLLDKYSGDTIPDTKIYQTSALLIRFNTNTFTPGMGWELEYTSSATAIEKHPDEKHFNVFPNPASTQFTVTAANHTLHKINVYTIDGRLFFSENVNLQSTHKVCIKNWPKGLYFIELLSENETEVKKVFIY